MRSLRGPLAQLVEQLAFNQLVAGSNPARPTIFSAFYLHLFVYLSMTIRSGTGSDNYALSFWV